MICSSCGKGYCFSHSIAHGPDKSCEQYEREKMQENALNQAKISSMAKKCPQCGIPIQKNGGCNHMKCSSCKCNFCWIWYEPKKTKSLESLEYICFLSIV